MLPRASARFVLAEVFSYNGTVNIIYESLKDTPLFIYPIGKSNGLVDHSGNSQSSMSATGTPKAHTGLVSGHPAALSLDSANYLTTPTTRFSRGNESKPFSIEAVYLNGSLSGSNTLVGHSDTSDGITIVGKKISFVTKYLNTGEARAEHQLQSDKVFHVVGVHTEEKNSLFVNGELVAEVTISDEQKNDSYLSTSSTLVVGKTTGSVAFGLLGFYNSTLTPERIMAHSVTALINSNVYDTPTSFNGDYIDNSLRYADVPFTQSWENDADFQSGVMQGLAYYQDALRPQFSGETSISGSWLTSVSLDSVNATTLHSIMLDWKGKGFTVDASLDGTTWVAATAMQNLSFVTTGFTTSGKLLQIRVSATGGVVSDDSFLSKLEIFCVGSDTSLFQNGRTLRWVATNPRKTINELHFDANSGTLLPTTSSSIVISADTTGDSRPVRTLEIWTKRLDTIGVPSISVTGTTYLNGVSTAAAMPKGEWILWHVVSSTAVSTAITITGPLQVASVSVYERGLTATEVANIYKSYYSNKIANMSATGSIIIGQSNDEVKIYSYDWSIQSSG